MPVIESVISWLFTPLSGASEHHIAMAVAWHGRLMVFACAILAPILVIIARFYKVTPRQDWPRVLDNPFWMVTHRRLGHMVGLIMLVGLGAVFASGELRLTWRTWHTSLGWIVIVLASAHIASSWFRGTHGGPMNPFTRQVKPPEQWRGDHYDMTRRRILFEYVHKSVGYVLLGLVIVVIACGLDAADAPRWMPLVIGLWWLLCLGTFIRLQRQGRCIDTYQAIWGLDDTLAGNRRKPIGWGIKRYTKSNDLQKASRREPTFTE